jgi:excisionase family DNA binding protein
MSDRLLSTEEVAERLGVPISTLHYWSYKGEELVGARIGRRLRYRESQVSAYIAAKFEARQREVAHRAGTA